MRNMTLLTLLTITMATLMGCASAPVEPKTDPALTQLNDVASSIQADLERLSKIKQADYEKVDLYESPGSGPLTKKLTLKWSGPIDHVLKVIAASINYDYKVKGESPAPAVLVNVDEVQTPAFEVLEDLGWKAGKHQVSVDAEQEIIQLTYFKATPPGGMNASLQGGK